MLGQRRHIQLELFTHTKQENSSEKSLQSSILERFASQEKNIILGICFIVVFILAYSLGIEKGKRINVATNITPAASRNKAQENIDNKEIKSINQENKPLNVKPEKKKADQIEFEGYTVQVASFRSKASAEKEKEALERKGYKAYVLPKNKYVIVCVGLFKDRETAQLNQKQLRRLYNDCLIRKL